MFYWCAGFSLPWTIVDPNALGTPLRRVNFPVLDTPIWDKTTPPASFQLTLRRLTFVKRRLAHRSARSAFITNAFHHSRTENSGSAHFLAETNLRLTQPAL